jgi:LacI family repressor for deo operon, udp, cdd, tsx, nupC, and nupG
VAKTSIKDIARIAGVSSATVSRTLSNPDLVSEETRNRVLKAVDQTGYTPNRFGASLRTQKSGNVLVVMPDITNQVNAGIIKAIEKEAHKEGYSVLLGDTQNDPSREKHYADLLTSGQADGMLLFTPKLPFPINDEKPLYDQIPPLVNSCEMIAHEEIYTVSINNFEGAKAAVNHLIELGHKKIAAIMGPLETPSALNRFDGYKSALEDAGIKLNPQFVIKGDYLVDTGIQAMEKLLRLKNRPTAVFCFSDDMAIGAMNALREYGYDIPQDMSVIGFDDITYAALVHPKLTTISQPLEQIGIQCMKLLAAQLKGSPPSKKAYELPFKLMLRQSTCELKESST